MNIDELREEIAYDEGVKKNDLGEHIIYLDHLSLPTLGIGHLIRESDPELAGPFLGSCERDWRGGTEAGSLCGSGLWGSA